MAVEAFECSAVASIVLQPRFSSPAPLRARRRRHRRLWSSHSRRRCPGSCVSKTSGSCATRQCLSCRRQSTQGGRNVVAPPPLPPDLVRLLDDGEARIRRRAAIAIGRVGLPDGVPRTRAAAADRHRSGSSADGSVRVWDSSAIGSAVEPLRAAVADPLPIVAGRAAEALGLLNDTASAPAIGQMVAAHAAAAGGDRARRRPSCCEWRG